MKVVDALPHRSFRWTGQVLALILFGSVTLACHAQVPEWIWHDNKGRAPQNNAVRCFRKEFQTEGDVTHAVLTAAGDDQAIVFLNGRQVAVNRSWARPTITVVTREVRHGRNLLAVRGRNNSGDAAVLVKLELTLANNEKQIVVSDATWLSSASELNNWYTLEFQPQNWAAAISRGKLGVQPWGDVLAPRVATPPDKITVLPGFRVELVRSAEPGEGSWVCLTIDAKGRLIFSPQEGSGNMLRATLSPAGTIEKLETISLPVGSAMGLLYAFDSLYVSGAGPRGLGLYRLRDTNSDDRFDELRLLKSFDGAAGEHGSHALALGPDNKIYFMHGNFVKVPPDVSPNSPHRNYAEDQLLPRAEDGNGFGVGINPPGGFVVRTDAEGKQWELIAAGLRNAYDFDFNPEGEMFTYDSDMEWDWGTPWYRPTRIYHLVSGGDYGFREGTGKFPSYYPDCLPPTLDVGIGSPTGVKFGTKSAFPDRYKKALFAMDWSYGRIFAVHLAPVGASYTATYEEFLRGKPLNVSDLEFGHDGAMYFLTGGRGTQSGLYRVTYAGTTPTEAERQTEPSREATAAAESRFLRRKLESYHGRRDPEASNFLWPHLDSPDRWIRYAARIALESQEVDEWRVPALDEKRVNACLTAMLALARVGPPGMEGDVLAGLGYAMQKALTEEQLLEALRALSVAFARMGKPDRETVNDVIAALYAQFPSGNPRLNRELAQLLIYLEAPGIAEKTLGLVESATTQEDQFHYIFHLRTLKSGWTLELRRRYFEWFNQSREELQHPPELIRWFQEAGRSYTDGSSFPKFLANIKKDAIETLSSEERAQLGSLLLPQNNPVPRLATSRPLVKEWTLEDFLPVLARAGAGRSFSKGKDVFAAAQCAACHRFGNEGGAVGQDLTSVASRYSRRDILESILLPSKVISEQYQNTTVIKKNGDELTGRVVEESAEKLVLVTNPLAQERTEIRKAEIARRIASKISPMPQGLVDTFSQEEILDLLAYLESGGNQNAPAFNGSGR